VPETLFTQDEESTASPSLTPPYPSPLIISFFREAANTMPSYSPPLALNHCWDNEGTPPPHHLRHPSPSFCPSPTPKQTLLLLKFFGVLYYLVLLFIATRYDCPDLLFNILLYVILFLLISSGPDSDGI